MIKKPAWWKSDTYVVLLGVFLLWTSRANGSSWQCSEERLVRSSDSAHSRMILADSHHLSYNLSDPILIQHPCEVYFSGGIPPALYLGEKVFISLDRFESSLFPLAISHTLVTPPALVSDATFVRNSRLLLVINGNVYIYFYHWKSWLVTEGIDKPITKISNMDCCYSTSDPACTEISDFVLVYDTGNTAEDRAIFCSTDGGYKFRPLVKIHPEGFLIGVYNFVSLSQIGMLYNQTEGNGNGSVYFAYSGTNDVNGRKGVFFSLRAYKNESVLSIIPPGMRGFVMLWTKHDLVFSFNSGLTSEPISVLPTDQYVNDSLPKGQKGVCNVAVTSNEVAALTKNQKLFYGTLDIVSTKMVLIGERNSHENMTHCEVLMFDTTGMLTIFSPVPNNESGFYNFHKCTINLQDRLRHVRPHLQPCPVEILSGDFHDKLYYIDMNEKLHLNITFVPKPGTGAFPYVTVSNPHVLGFQAKLLEDGYTYDGNTKYCLQITALQQQFTGIAELDFQDDLLHPRVSTLTVDIYNKGIFCIDMHPLTALITMECPPTKHIRPFKNVTVCNKGVFHEAKLQKNFHYTIHRDIYDPTFLGKPHIKQEDLNITYSYTLFGCPILWYFDSPWLPILELWEDDKFVEYVSADFVLFEINGMHNYDYLLTASEANCISQPQNWSSMFEWQLQPDPHTAWSRTNYESCKVPSELRPLESPSIKYQILNLNEENRVVFSQYNGIYVFKAIVVDSLYSYCELSTAVSVYVLGALPKSQINPVIMLTGVLTLIFGSILMGYFFPKLLHSRGNTEIKSL